MLKDKFVERKTQIEASIKNLTDQINILGGHLSEATFWITNIEAIENECKVETIVCDASDESVVSEEPKNDEVNE